MNKIRLTGRIVFDPKDVTAKHAKQALWKKVAMVSIGSDISNYYAWFIRRRYNINLLPPLRKAHVTFINDKVSEMNGDWEKVKKKWNGKKVVIVIELEAKTDSDNKGSKYCWWLELAQEEREELHSIRRELGLKRPHFGLHMTVGRAVNFTDDANFIPHTEKAKEMNIEQSKYIHRLIKNGQIKV